MRIVEIEQRITKFITFVLLYFTTFVAKYSIMTLIIGLFIANILFTKLPLFFK